MGEEVASNEEVQQQREALEGLQAQVWLTTMLRVPVFLKQRWLATGPGGPTGTGAENKINLIREKKRILRRQ